MASLFSTFFPYFNQFPSIFWAICGGRFILNLQSWLHWILLFVSFNAITSALRLASISPLLDWKQRINDRKLKIIPLREIKISSGGIFHLFSLWFRWKSDKHFLCDWCCIAAVTVVVLLFSFERLNTFFSSGIYLSYVMKDSVWLLDGLISQNVYYTIT